MKALRPFLVYIGLLFFLAAATAYPLFELFQSVVAADLSFDSFVGKLLRLFGLLGLWPLLGALQLNSRSAWGYAAPRKQFVRDLFFGTAFGLLTLLVLILMLLLLDVRTLDADMSLTPGGVAEIIGTAVIAALLIAWIEETWFRGALQSAVARYTNRLKAGAIVASLYAAAHFVRPEVQETAEGVGWWSGFEAVSGAFDGFRTTAFIDSFLALMMAGFLLALARYKTGSIAQCIGIHAGWVIVIKTVRKLTDVNPESRWVALVGDYDGILGYLAFGWLALLSAVYYRFYLRSR